MFLAFTGYVLISQGLLGAPTSQSPSPHEAAVCPAASLWLGDAQMWLASQRTTTGTFVLGPGPEEAHFVCLQVFIYQSSRLLTCTHPSFLTQCVQAQAHPAAHPMPPVFLQGCLHPPSTATYESHGGASP